MKIASRFLTRPDAAEMVEMTLDGETLTARAGETVAGQASRDLGLTDAIEEVLVHLLHDRGLHGVRLQTAFAVVR